MVCGRVDLLQAAWLPSLPGLRANRQATIAGGFFVPVAGFGFCCVLMPKLASLLQVENKNPPARDERGRLLPGGTANPRGRPALPDFFKDAAPLALQHLVNVATGVEFVEPELRLKAATLVVERFYGKAPETVTLEGELAISRIVRTIVDPKSDG